VELAEIGRYDAHPREEVRFVDDRLEGADGPDRVADQRDLLLLLLLLLLPRTTSLEKSRTRSLQV